ncbi:hypothetical protein KO317_03545 [Candidatus Micrarchaeota archaeon]|jgi:predicted protein tyrosine phosphatase|nr:hypothetical protein [Candidatus Micrarchaeota archaeon]
MKHEQKQTDKPKKNRKNRFLSIAVLTSTLILGSIGYESKPKINPEYERQLNTIFLHYAHTEFETQKTLISSLPEYSKIIFLVDTRLKERLELRFEREIKSKQISIIDYEIETPLGLFIQDQMELIKQKEKPILLLPKHYYGRPNKNLEKALVKNGFEVRRAEVAFTGGNITYDRFNKKNILFVGENDIELNLIYDPDYKREEIISVFKKEFNVDTVLIVGPQDKTKMYHLDLLFTIIGPGEVVLNEPIIPLIYEKAVPNEVSELIKNTRHMFESLGYIIHSFPMQIDDLIKCKYYLCAIPFIDKNSKDRRILIPLFPERGVKYPIASDKNREVRNFFIDKNIYPTSVNDYLFYTNSGGLHCISFVYD